jgi:hypothetical protein
MNRQDQRVVQIARVLAGIRRALGLPLNTRADLMTAFAAEERGELQQLHEALGKLIDVAATSTDAVVAQRDR